MAYLGLTLVSLYLTSALAVAPGRCIRSQGIIKSYNTVPEEIGFHTICTF